MEGHKLSFAVLPHNVSYLFSHLYASKCFVKLLALNLFLSPTYVVPSYAFYSNYHS